MPSRLANSWSDRARPVASSSNHARPRAIALLRAGSHRELRSCCANPGSTNLVSIPRCLKATAAVSSTALCSIFSGIGDQRSGDVVGHRQLGISRLTESAMGLRDAGDTHDYAAIATPVTWAQVAKAWVRPDPRFAAVSWSRRRGNTLAT